MSKSVDERIKENLRDKVTNTAVEIKKEFSFNAGNNKSSKPEPKLSEKQITHDFALRDYLKNLEKRKPTIVGENEYSCSGYQESRAAQLEDFYVENYNSSKIFKKIGPISNFTLSSIYSPYGAKTELYWEAFPLNKREAVVIAYDPNIEAFRYHHAEGIRRKYHKEREVSYNVDGDCGTNRYPAYYEELPHRTLLEKLTFTREPDDWVMRTGSEKVYHSEEELKEQFLDDIAKGIESHVSRTPLRLTKIFGALTLAGWLLHSCATDANAKPSNDQTLIAPPETTIAFEP